MVERPNIFWQIYVPLMIFIFCLMHIMATTKRVIEKIKEWQTQNIVNIQINPEEPEGTLISLINMEGVQKLPNH